MADSSDENQEEESKSTRKQIRKVAIANTIRLFSLK